MISWNVNIPGCMTPLRATSIIPLEVTTPIMIPTAATDKITFIGATFAPNAEFKKFTASFDTPTIKSKIASNANTIMIIVKIGLIIDIFSIFCLLDYL